MSIFDRLKTILAKPKKKKIEEVTPAVPGRAQEIILEAREEATRIKKEAQEEAERLRQKEAEIAKRLGALEEKEKYLISKDEEAKTKLAEIDKIKQEQVAKLERAAGLTRDEAKNLILTAVEDHLKEDIGKRIREAETQAKEEADRKAREILVEAMRRGAIDYVAEYTVSTVKLTDEDLKGRIIGKEGRNIRAFEMATGVDVDLDEEGVIRLSSFDPIRREIGRLALERLIADGRIQPARIEEIVERTKKDLEKIMFEEGEKLAHSVGVYNLPADKLALLGRFKYRFSYGQNMITHTLEETKIGVALASEVKADINIVRLGCLLHDIGKVITEEEGTHVSLGADLLRKNGIPQAVIACVEEHHEEKPFSSIESMIVYIADAISGARPGARYEDYEEYLKRLSELENIAKQHEGIKEAYAFQAGREIRVIVDPGVLDDAAATVLAQKIKEEIEKKLTYPGQVKVTVIRELRVTETAK
jgi:ribonuclease Y